MRRCAFTRFLALAAAFALSGSARGDLIYWTDANRVARANSDGSMPTTVLTAHIPTGVTVDQVGGKIYYAQIFPGEIDRANLDGSSPQVLVTGLSGLNAQDIAVDPGRGKVYWTDEISSGGVNNFDVRRANLDGSSPETIVTGGAPHGIALDLAGGKVYWTDAFSGPSGDIRRANLDGSSPETLVTGLNAPWNVAVDVSRGKLYWTELRPGAVRRANLDGSSEETLITGYDSTRGFALDVAGGKMYLADVPVSSSSLSEIRRANLDGSGLQTILSGQNPQGGLAFVPTTAVVPEPSSVLLLALGLAGLGIVELHTHRREVR